MSVAIFSFITGRLAVAGRRVHRSRRGEEMEEGRAKVKGEG